MAKKKPQSAPKKAAAARGVFPFRVDPAKDYRVLWRNGYKSFQRGAAILEWPEHYKEHATSISEA